MNEINRDIILESRLIGYIEDFDKNPEHARVTVIGYKSDENNEYIALDEQTAKKIFHPEGKVFAAKFNWELTKIKKNSFIEFTCKLSERNIGLGGDDYIVNYDSSCKIYQKSFAKVISISEKSTLDEDYITSNEILHYIDSSFFDDYTDKLFIRYKEFFYGCFKYDSVKKEILPQKGKETKKYQIDEINYKKYCRMLKDQQYYLGTIDKIPFQQVGEIDCMSDTQLTEWFKERLKTITSTEKLLSKELMHSLTSCMDTNNQILKIRYDRIAQKIDNMQFNYDYIKDLLMSDSKLLERIKLSIETERNSFETEWLEKIEKDNRILLQDKEKLEKEKQLLKNEIDTYKQKILQKEKELEASLSEKREKIEHQINETQFALDVITEEYDSLVVKLRAAVPQFGNNIENPKEINCLSPIIFPKSGKTFRNAMQSKGITFQICFLQNILPFEIPEIYFQNIFSVLFKNRAAFIPNISYAYIFAKGIQNSKLFIMNVEHDWLHYKDFCDNGLLQVLESCYDNPNENHILVFDSINLTQPECGLRPFLDVINGYSLIIPKLNRRLPKNIKILATIQPTKNDIKIGLELNHDTFQKWGFVGTPNDKIELSNDFLENTNNDELTHCTVEELNKQIQFDKTTLNGDTYFEY